MSLEGIEYPYSSQSGFESGDKVVFLPENKVYDFGYYSASPGFAVIYEEGERNMQDSYAVKLEKLRPAPTTNRS